MMLKRWVLCLFLLFPVFAEASEVYVVKIINFYCQYCRGSEFIDKKISEASKKSGGSFTYAPLTVQEGLSDNADRVFYASRRFGDEVSTKIRRELFAGAQDHQLPFEDLSQVLVYLQRKLPELSADWALLAQFSQKQEVSDSIKKAMQLAHAGGITSVPAYAVVSEGELVSMFEMRGTDASKYYELQESVLSHIEKLAKKGN